MPRALRLLSLVPLLAVLAACLPEARSGQRMPGGAPGTASLSLETIEAAPIGAAPVQVPAPTPGAPGAGEPTVAATADQAQGQGAAAATPPPPRPGATLPPVDRPATEAPVPDPQAPAAAMPPPSPEAQLCLKTGGLWVKVGTGGLMTCVKPTRDAGKACRRGSDCEGLCLARSFTCAPYDPLFGCNEILQDDGSRVTYCLQ